MTEDSAQRYLSNDRPGGGFWNALDQPVTDALVASAPKRAGSAENGVAHTTETPANSPIHARLSFGTGREMVDGTANTLLFARRFQKIKSKTQAFVYCGRLEFAESEPDTSKPVHLIFRSLDYDDYSTNDDLLDIHQST